MTSPMLNELRELEKRLGLAPAVLLGIRSDSSIADACVAFVDLAAVHHPRFYAEWPESVRSRAIRAYAALRDALNEFVLLQRTLTRGVPRGRRAIPR